MNNQELITALLLKDMKHNQLVLGMEQLGFVGDDYHTLQIYDIVAGLMGLKPGTISNEWSDIYFLFMEKAMEYDIEPLGKNLIPLAEECYKKLLACLDKERII